METKRRIIYDEPGQTCNLFWSYLESVSWAILNRKRVYILWWDPSIKNYGALRHNKYVRFPLYRPLLIKIFGEARYKRHLKKFFDGEKARSFFTSSRGQQMGFIQGWPTREAGRYFPQVKDEALKLFRPDGIVCEKVHQAFLTARKQYCVIIGIHMRRGDYCNWREGKYFYSIDEYNGIMTRIEALFPGQKIGFYIATNESLHSDLRPNEFHGIGGAAEDLYALSNCDYIAGPPSTFSKWASLMGHKPLHIIYDASEDITSIDIFSPLKTHTTFENGTTVW